MAKAGSSRWPCWLAVLSVLCAMQPWMSQGLWAQAPSPAPSAPAVRALLISDIHFDPFLDPGKVERLKAAPAAEWRAILAAPESADRAAQLEALHQACPTRGEDTSNTLFQSSLRAIHANAGGAKFVLVSGDLMAHNFACKFDEIVPNAKPGEYGVFVEKTIEYVMHELRAAVPGVPVYAALGNNDTDCDDYRLDANSPFLADAGKVLTADVPAPERAAALKSFAVGGYYSVDLPAPMHRARLLVLDDLFESKRYASCGGKVETAPAEEQIAWLKAQLDEVRLKKVRVWVMAHIPPGIDPYATARKMANVCGGAEPQMFLSSEALPETLAHYGDVLKLAVFGHTHMDELRLLEPKDGEGMAERGIAVKLVGSISPINGNAPSFTVASIDATTAVLKDYHVIVASNASGPNASSGTKWAEEYDWAKTYKQSAFNAIGVRDEIAGFGADSMAKDAASQSYLRYYGSGLDTRALSLFWKPYICALGFDAIDAYKKCVCGQ